MSKLTKPEQLRINGVQPKALGKKVKLFEKMSQKDINELLKTKQEELKKK